MLQETLVMIGGEFGRTPAVEVSGLVQRAERPRPQQPRLQPCCSQAAASRAASTYGATDDFGFKAVENPVHVHDLHATMLHLLGLDHTRLTYRYSGRDFRLTDVHGRVIKEILA